MKVGDTIKATWADGLVLTGKYVKTDRGYVILNDDKGRQIVCCVHNVKLEIVNEDG